ncbi:MAG: DUF2752 domain-containing protein [Candidatus Omnitrophica bacterium]|nr:DUF2752 domain-containing protein [Candidatus Omnitrophota bacterium]
MRNSKLLFFKVISLYILLPVTLFFIPLSSLQNLPSLCLYKAIFGIECPGCGITRALLSLLHFNLYDTLNYNRLVVIVFPVLVYIFLKQAFFEIMRLLNFRNNRQG